MSDKKIIMYLGMHNEQTIEIRPNTCSRIPLYGFRFSYSFITGIAAAIFSTSSMWLEKVDVPLTLLHLPVHGMELGVWL